MAKEEEKKEKPEEPKPQKHQCQRQDLQFAGLIPGGGEKWRCRVCENEISATGNEFD